MLLKMIKTITFLLVLYVHLVLDCCTLASSLGILNYGRNLLAPSSTTHLANLFAAYDTLQKEPPSSITELFQNNMTSRVEVTTHNVVAGNGLVAKQRFEAGQVVALYPIHALGYAQGKEPPVTYSSSSNKDTTTRALVGTSDLICFENEARHFGVLVNGGDDDETQELVDYSYTMLDPSGRYIFDANPSRRLTNDLFVAHFVNDASGAVFEDDDPVTTAVRYLSTSLTRFNCVMTPFGPPPLMAYVTLQPVEKGSEFLASYGLDYWLGKVENEDEEHQLRDILDASPEVQRALQQYDAKIDSVVDQAAVVSSDLHKDHIGLIRKAIKGYLARKRRPWRQRLRHWLRLLQ